MGASDPGPTPPPAPTAGAAPHGAAPHGAAPGGPGTPAGAGTGVRTIDGGSAWAVRDQLVETYRAVFCAPPWNEPPARAVRFAELLALWVEQPGFTAVLAGQDSALTGFALGLTTPDPFPDDRAYGQVRRLLGPAAEALSGALEVAELAVLPSARRGGLGRRLLDALVADHPAWLLTVPGIAGTAAFYDAVGWLRHATGYGITVYTNRPLPDR
ncbi:GNAT family N-acetyltransferase [Plantactinospora sp. B24E8]|uniref:GNAT family N-acetyltransferase n=1 Tax=Plantactinospora sp. B24E8 TaxID=3153567 RepID=UPI00325D6E4A